MPKPVYISKFDALRLIDGGEQQLAELRRNGGGILIECSGAKLYYDRRRRRYYIHGYAENGSDVTRALESIGLAA